MQTSQSLASPSLMGLFTISSQAGMLLWATELCKRWSFKCSSLSSTLLASSVWNGFSRDVTRAVRQIQRGECTKRKRHRSISILISIQVQNSSSILSIRRFLTWHMWPCFTEQVSPSYSQSLLSATSFFGLPSAGAWPTATRCHPPWTTAWPRMQSSCSLSLPYFSCLMAIGCLAISKCLAPLSIKSIRLEKGCWQVIRLIQLGS